MNYTPEQIASIVLKVLKDIETPDVSSLSYEEKLELAQNPNTSQETLQVLATDEYSSVRYWVAENPNTPLEFLKVLATDKNWGVRRGVARNPNTPQELLQVLATDEDCYLRYWAKNNPNYKKQTLELTSTQYEALKKLIESGQDESLKDLMVT
jgi:hypothetical protein